MTRIKATGEHFGKTLTVEFIRKDDDVDQITFDGERNETLEDELMIEIERRHPVAGTFVPKKDSTLNMMNTIQYHFFDEPVRDIEVEGFIEEMPSEEGRIY